MTRRAWVGDVVLSRHLGRDELERMGPHFDVCDGLGCFRHVAGHALAPGAVFLVMGVVLQCGRIGTVKRARPMTIQTQLVRWLSELCVVVGAVCIVAAKTGHAVLVHRTLHKVVALHPILVRGTVWEMRIGFLA